MRVSGRTKKLQIGWDRKERSSPSSSPEKQPAPAAPPETRAGDWAGGIVALHGASASFGNSPVWQRLLGAKFSGHAPGLFPLEVEIVNPKSPITRGVSAFQTMDEEYHHTFVSGAERHVLARFKERPSLSTDPKGNRDVASTRTSGKGRIYYNALGHDEKSW